MLPQVDRVVFCLFLEKDVKIYEREMQRFFPVKENEEENVEMKDEKEKKNEEKDKKEEEKEEKMDEDGKKEEEKKEDATKTKL